LNPPSIIIVQVEAEATVNLKEIIVPLKFNFKILVFLEPPCMGLALNILVRGKNNLYQNPRQLLTYRVLNRW
jgi:hypothetical protein